MPVPNRRRSPRDLSAAVVGSGPNGLTAAIALRATDLDVTLFEAHASLGGGVRSEPGPRPGYLRDVCSSVYPLSMASPAFKAMDLHRFGLEWAVPPIAFAHPLADGSAVAPVTDPEAPEGLGPDAVAWQRGVEHKSDRLELIAEHFLGPLRLPPPHPGLLKFGLPALRSSNALCQSLFETERARALFAGAAAHAALPLDKPVVAGAGLVLASLAKAIGWPFAKWGTQAIAQALAALACKLGVKIATGTPITEAAQLRVYDIRMLDTSPRQALTLAGPEPLAKGVIERLHHNLQGPAVHKVDYALSEPIPWRATAARQAGTLHLGGTRAEIAAALDRVWAGKPAAQPFVLLGQPSVADPSRAPAGHHAAWAYCHVPPGWRGDAGPAIERQIERFAPGFGDTVLARRVTLGSTWAGYNANWVGGDILGGAQDWRWHRQPLGGWRDPWCLHDPDLYLCSAATPPGAGVHGLCGWHAARSALRRNRGITLTLEELRSVCGTAHPEADCRALRQATRLQCG